MATLDGPRWGPPEGRRARQLVVLCHGVGADGHDLIDLAPAWSHALPEAAFVVPSAPERYDQRSARDGPAMVQCRGPHARGDGTRGAACRRGAGTIH